MVAAGGHGDDLYREGFFLGGPPTSIGSAFIAAMASPGTTSAAAYGAELTTEIQSGRPRAYNRQYWQDRSPANVVQQVVDKGIPVLALGGVE